jgi:OmcA/MtrC family decaheme c-type cytochrome
MRSASNLVDRITNLGTLVTLLMLAACSGTTGVSGSPGPTGATGAAGTTTTGATINIATATAITGTITSVTIAGQPVVQFKITDQNGALLQGLPAADLGFAIAQLVPGTNGGASQWNSYVYKTVPPYPCPAGVVSCATTPQIQATVEAATTGTFVDNGDGTYQYTFNKNITTDPNVIYNAALTHRVAFEIRGLAQANNGSYTFQPSTGATTGIFGDEIVVTATCNDCHTSFATSPTGTSVAHGGARVEVQYCVMCHNPGTTDPNSGNTLDMAVMIHKIHTGNTLPSIQTATVPDTTPTLGSGYWIVGYMGSLNNFNTVLYPQDTRHCAACHVQNLPAAPQAADFANVPTAASCGACHDNVNFVTGLNHAGGIQLNDTQCAVCHGPASTIGGGNLTAVAAHVIPADVAAAKFLYVVNKVSFTTDGAHNIYPVVNFSVVDPTNGNAPYDILTTPGFAGIDTGTGELVCAEDTARLAIDIAWDTSDYTNWGGGVTPAAWGQPISLNPLNVPGCPAAAPITGPDANGAFTVTSPTPLPTPPALDCPPLSATLCPAIANVAVVIEGHPGLVLTGPGSPGPDATAIPVTSAVAYANVAGGTPVPRRVVVDVAQCNVCHNMLALHGDNRNNNIQVCVVCHNPASTDVGSRQTLSGTVPGSDGLWEESIDFKVMIHALHDGNNLAAAGSPFVIYGYGGSVNNFSDVVYPGYLNRCDVCHVGTSFYPVDDTAVQATTLTTGLSTQSPPLTALGDPIATSANMALCSACHKDYGYTATEAHIEQNGGSLTVRKDAEGRTILGTNPAQVESCSVCHGPGGVADVAVAHHLPATSH